MIEDHKCDCQTIEWNRAQLNWITQSRFELEMNFREGQNKTRGKLGPNYQKEKEWN